MRGPGLFDHTDWKSKKRSARPQMSLFSLKMSVESKKKVFVVRDEVSHFLRGPRLQAA